MLYEPGMSCQLYVCVNLVHSVMLLLANKMMTTISGEFRVTSPFLFVISLRDVPKSVLKSCRARMPVHL